MRDIALISKKIYTTGTHFTRPPVVTVATNLNSAPSPVSSAFTVSFSSIASLLTPRDIWDQDLISWTFQGQLDFVSITWIYDFIFDCIDIWPTFDQRFVFLPLKIGNSYCGWAHPLHFKTAMKWRLFLLVLGLCQPLGFLRNLLSRSINYFNQSCFPIRLSVPRHLEEKLPNICGDKSILVSG